MIVLGFDTATAATTVALLDDGRDDAAAEGRAGGGGAERRHDPAPGERPGHAALLLALAHELLEQAGLTFADVDRVAVGVGPGGFTGLRIGVATARALAQSADAEIVGVSTLRALAAGPPPADGHGVLAVVDARRGEVFLGGWRDGEQVIGPLAVAPGQVGEVAGPGWLAVGDGALRYRDELQCAGCLVPPDASERHRVSALTVCRLALGAGRATELALVVPGYLRAPDAVRRRAPS